MPRTQKLNCKSVARDKFEELAEGADNNKELWNKLILHNTTKNLKREADTLTKTVKKAAEAHAPPHNIKEHRQQQRRNGFLVKTHHKGLNSFIIPSEYNSHYPSEAIASLPILFG